jgi:hypothetical protein
MNADPLLALYEKVADALDAIARLRRFVLDLAVRGKPRRQRAPEVGYRISSMPRPITAQTRHRCTTQRMTTPSPEQ